MTRRNDQPRQGPGARAFLVPVLWIAALLASYWLIADWQALPNLIGDTFSSIG